MLAVVFVKYVSLQCKQISFDCFVASHLYIRGVKICARQLSFIASASIWCEKVPPVHVLNKLYFVWCEKLPPAAFLNQTIVCLM
jgi:hypothetical protein